MVLDWKGKYVYFLWKSYKIRNVSCTNVDVEGIPSLIHEKKKFLDDPVIAPDKARQALFWIKSSFLQNVLLQASSKIMLP